MSVFFWSMRIQLIQSRPIIPLESISPSQRRIVNRSGASFPRTPRTLEETSNTTTRDESLNRLISRRFWILSAWTVGVPASLLALPGCNERTATELAALILADILQFAVDKAIYALNEELGGVVELENTTDEPATGALDMELLSSQSIPVDDASGDYSVPPRTANIYSWRGMRSNQAGPHNIKAQTRSGSALTPTFSIG